MLLAGVSPRAAGRLALSIASTAHKATRVATLVGFARPMAVGSARLAPGKSLVAVAAARARMILDRTALVGVSRSSPRLLSGLSHDTDGGELAKARRIADDRPDDPEAQERLLEILARENPMQAIRRFESAEYASSDGCAKQYIRALVSADRLNQTNLDVMLGRNRGGQGSRSSSGGGGGFGMSQRSSFRGESQSGTNSGWGGSSRGSEDEPVVVSIQQPSSKAQFWKLVRSLLVLLVVLSAVNQIMEDRGLGGRAGMSHQEVKPESQAQMRTFADVQGADEAKAELQDVVEFLRNPSEFTRLGGKLPKGVLLTGPPGTGKTLLARAVAGEAGVPFFYASGSEFDEMFVGVGARRVRELFTAAKRKGPAIVFLDEIDAVGGRRSAKDQQYSKMTLNQLLVELDGFAPSDEVIVIAATNFPEMLDPALIRPGRFDTRVAVPLPDMRGREAILAVHAKDVPLADETDLRKLARGTPGFSGAELANVVNQAALRASIEHKDKVDLSTLEWAKDKIMMGPERKGARITDKDLKVTAYHEGGHALCAMYTEGAVPLYKATIVPRGNALGLVQQLPEDDTNSVTVKELEARLVVCMGGRAAEERIYGKENTTSGASSDLEQATRIARAMVTKYGFSDKVGPISLDDESGSKLSEIADTEIRRLCQEALDKAHALLRAHDREHHRLATALLEYETLNAEEMTKVVRGERLA